MTATVSVNTVEHAALGWFEALGCGIRGERTSRPARIRRYGTATSRWCWNRIAVDQHRLSRGRHRAGCARWMRQALPNATFVGFTDTPLEGDDRSTPAVFGDYADIYNIPQAITDNATVPIYYEMRLVKLLPDEPGTQVAEDKINAIAQAGHARTKARRRRSPGGSRTPRTTCGR